MSERPKWMPSREGLLSLAHNETLYKDCGHAYAGEELEEMVKDAVHRAQVAVLEEVIDAGDTWEHSSQFAVAKIAALREELGE